MNARAQTFRLISTLLIYPVDELLASGADLLDEAVQLPPSPGRDLLLRFLDWYLSADPSAVARHYVETFDMRRRSSLYLTYYLHGDTRRRGMALLTLKQSYRASGLIPPEDELPDYLPLVCEFAAIAGPDRGESPLRQHRAGIELIRAGLHDAESPFADVLDALCEQLPRLSPTQRTRIVGIAAEGPPAEDVGLEPFGPPQYLTGQEIRA